MSKSILIVDDEFGLAEIVGELLDDRGFRVTLAMNGKQGLERLGEGHFDLVLLDVMMPILDGPTMLARMRQDPLRATIPVIMMSAVQKALPPLQPPHVASLLKPFTPDRLIELIDLHLRVEGSSDPH